MLSGAARLEESEAIALAREAPLISVIVPLYNAAHTIEPTLRSALAQTYRPIEIIVVDDGSTDASPDIVARLAAENALIRFDRQPNAGVAAARNRAIALAQGQYIAPLDADDLWRPTKLARQMAAMLARGPATALCYTRFLAIDAEDRILYEGPANSFAGAVLHHLAREDFVGSGSNALMRADLVRAVRGYDSSLRQRGAEGAEDWLIAMALAERGEFAYVDEPLVGYRRSRGNMSSRAQQMLASARLVAARYATRYPDLAERLDAHLRDREKWLFVRALAEGNWRDARAIGGRLRGASGLARTAMLAARERAASVLRASGLRPARRF